MTYWPFLRNVVRLAYLWPRRMSRVMVAFVLVIPLLLVIASRRGVVTDTRPSLQRTERIGSRPCGPYGCLLRPLRPLNAGDNNIVGSPIQSTVDKQAIG